MEEIEGKKTFLISNFYPYLSQSFHDMEKQGDLPTGPCSVFWTRILLLIYIFICCIYYRLGRLSLSSKYIAGLSLL